VAALRTLLDHPDRKVRLEVAVHCKVGKLHVEAALEALHRLALGRDQISADAQSSLDFEPYISTGAEAMPTRTPPSFTPPPEGIDRRRAETLIGEKFRGSRQAALIALLRPAIRLWPRPLAVDPTASRFGGMPMVPKRWTWPLADEEPFQFLAQINLAELGPLADAYGLPEQGLLSVFGDPDEVQGCGPASGGEMFYFPTLDGLAAAPLPIDEHEPFVCCGMGFYESFELPHAWSDAIRALGFSEREKADYADLCRQMQMAKAFNTETSKLCGWPDLVQRELEPPDTDEKAQLGEWHDGNDTHGWGPGGLIFFQIAEHDLATRHFERAYMEVQCT